MSASEIIGQILRNPAFYAALIALLNACLDYFAPDFPPTIKAALNGLLTVVFAGITAASAVRTVRVTRAVRAAMLEKVQ